MDRFKVPASVVVLIAARDEAATIAEVVRGCREWGCRVVVAADHCRDGTVEEAEGAGAEVWRHAGRAGKARALRWAWGRLLGEAGWEYLVLMDGDGQHDPGELGRLWAESGPGRLVVGDRAPFRAPMPWGRRWTNRAMSALVSWRCGVKVPDSQSGYRVVPRRLVAEGRWRAGRFELESEMVVEARRLGMEVVSVPVECRYPAGGRASHIMVVRDACRWVVWLGRSFFGVAKAECGR